MPRRPSATAIRRLRQTPLLEGLVSGGSALVGAVGAGATSAVLLADLGLTRAGVWRRARTGAIFLGLGLGLGFGFAVGLMRAVAVVVVAGLGGAGGVVTARVVPVAGFGAGFGVVVVVGIGAGSGEGEGPAARLGSIRTSAQAPASTHAPTRCAALPFRLNSQSTPPSGGAVCPSRFTHGNQPREAVQRCEHSEPPGVGDQEACPRGSGQASCRVTGCSRLTRCGGCASRSTRPSARAA